MKSINILFVTLTTLCVTSFANNIKNIDYKVQKGDSLYVIAKRYHTTIETLRQLNKMKTNDVLKAGKSIKVPIKKLAKCKIEKKTKSQSKKKVKIKKHIVKVVPVKVKEVKKKPHKRRFSLSEIVFGHRDKSVEKSKKIIALAKKKLGHRYVWGAEGEGNTFDCSGFTAYVCKANGITLPRRAIQQSHYGKAIGRSDLKPGDLVFFDTSKHHEGYVNHVGIYIGNGKFIHASSAKKKVVITSLNKPFYSQRFKGARRVTSL